MTRNALAGSRRRTPFVSKFVSDRDFAAKGSPSRHYRSPKSERDPITSVNEEIGVASTQHQSTSISPRFRRSSLRRRQATATLPERAAGSEADELDDSTDSEYGIEEDAEDDSDVDSISSGSDSDDSDEEDDDEKDGENETKRPADPSSPPQVAQPSQIKSSAPSASIKVPAFQTIIPAPAGSISSAVSSSSASQAEPSESLMVEVPFSDTQSTALAGTSSTMLTSSTFRGTSGVAEPTGEAASQQNVENREGATSKAADVGIALGTLALASLFIIAAIIFYRRRKRSNKDHLERLPDEKTLPEPPMFTLSAPPAVGGIRRQSSIMDEALGAAYQHEASNGVYLEKNLSQGFYAPPDNSFGDRKDQVGLGIQTPQPANAYAHPLQGYLQPYQQPGPPPRPPPPPAPAAARMDPADDDFAPPDGFHHYRMSTTNTESTSARWG